jgi:hypothetical protein
MGMSTHGRRWGELNLVPAQPHKTHMSPPLSGHPSTTALLEGTDIDGGSPQGRARPYGAAAGRSRGSPTPPRTPPPTAARPPPAATTPGSHTPWRPASARPGAAAPRISCPPPHPSPLLAPQPLPHPAAAAVEAVKRRMPRPSLSSSSTAARCATSWLAHWSCRRWRQEEPRDHDVPRNWKGASWQRNGSSREGDAGRERER